MLKNFENFENFDARLIRVLSQNFSGTLTNDARASFPIKNWSRKSARLLPMTRVRAKCAFFPEIFSGTLTNDARAFDARRYAYFTIGLLKLY